MKKRLVYFLSAAVLLLLLFMVLLPYLTANFLEERRVRELEADRERLTAETLAQKIKEENLKKVAYLLGKFDPTTREGFAPVPEELGVSGYKMYLRKEALEAFFRMKQAAKINGLDLKIASAARNFDYQKKLWNNKWTGYTLVNGEDLSQTVPDGRERFVKILEWSAVPGTSRHHWGTDIDINNANPEYFETKTGKKVYEWLTANAPLFGFCQTYIEKKGSAGYKEEKWHWSYMPLARDFLREYEVLVNEKDIGGFLGEEYAPDFDLVNDYVLNISPDCLQNF